MDTALVDRLIEILNTETSIYENILKLSKNKTDVIIAGKVSELEGITRLEQSIIIKLGKLEEEREEAVERLAAELDSDAADITLAGLLEILPKEQSEKLKHCHETLSKNFSQLCEANVLNSRLIRNSLEYIDFSINILTNAGSTGNYGNSGRSDDQRKRNFFDMKL